jgi:hypothetical protein
MSLGALNRLNGRKGRGSNPSQRDFRYCWNLASRESVSSASALLRGIR